MKVNTSFEDMTKYEYVETNTAQNHIHDEIRASKIQTILRDFGDFPMSKSTDHRHNLSMMHEDTDEGLSSIHLTWYNLTQDVCCT
jgi:hypothetical protein